MSVPGIMSVFQLGCDLMSLSYPRYTFAWVPLAVIPDINRILLAKPSRVSSLNPITYCCSSPSVFSNALIMTFQSSKLKYIFKGFQLYRAIVTTPGVGLEICQFQSSVLHRFVEESDFDFVRFWHSPDYGWPPGVAHDVSHDQIPFQVFSLTRGRDEHSLLQFDILRLVLPFWGGRVGVVSDGGPECDQSLDSADFSDLVVSLKVSN